MKKGISYHFSAKKIAARRAALAEHAGRPVTQADIAKRADLLLPNYARFEGGDTNPTLDTAVRVARALGCLVEDLIA